MSNSAAEHTVTYAMTVLVADVEEAQRLAAALDDVRRPDGSLSVIAVPPVRGLAFFADSDRQAKLDRWWAHAIPVGSVPVHLILHEPGIPGWLPGLDGRFIVGVSIPEEAAAYAGMANVTVADGDSLLDLALTAVEQAGLDSVFREDAAMRLDKRLRRPAVDASRFRRARLKPADEMFRPVSMAPRAHHHPIPNLPPEGVQGLAADARREDLVRALAETLLRLQRIRSAT